MLFNLIYIYVYMYMYIYIYIYIHTHTLDDYILWMNIQNINIYYIYICTHIYIYIHQQARAQTFWGAGAQTKKKGTQCQKKILTVEA